MHFSPFKIILLVAVLLFAVFVQRQCSSYGQAFQEIPKYVPSFEAQNMLGEKVFFGEVKGEVTLVVLTASWCPSCRAELPSLRKIHEAYESRGLKVVMIDEDEDFATAQKYQEKEKFPWTMLFWNYDAMNAFGNPRVIPVNFLVDAKDSITYVGVGIFDEREMRSAIEGLLTK